jgi:hypothetical protein
MIEVKTVLPRYDNHGISLASEIGAIVHDVLTIASGFTATEVVGQWQDESGEIYKDVSVEITTLVPTEKQVHELHLLIEQAKISMRQQAMFFQAHEVEAEFI